MKYMVMECGLGYAIVLDEDGRFLRVPNLGYEVGQTVENIVLFPETEEDGVKHSFIRRNISRLTAVAACLCLLIIGSQQFLFQTYGTVRMQINPDVLLSVNRLDYVTDAEGLNADGDDLIEAYRYFGKKVEKVTDELSVLAMEKGYLNEDGQIWVTVESEHEAWKQATEELLVTKISIHLPETIRVEAGPQKTEISVPVYAETEDDRDDDDDWEDDWYDDWDDDDDDDDDDWDGDDDDDDDNEDDDWDDDDE